MELIILKTQECAKVIENKWNRAAPIIYILIGTFLISINSLLGKTVGMNANQIVYVRGIVMCLLGQVIANISKVDLYGFQRDVYTKLFQRSIIGCFATLLFYTGLRYVNIAEAQVLLQTSPFWTTLIAIYYLKTETLSWKLFTNLIVCFIGIIFITQPPFLKTLLGQSVDIIKNSETQFFGCILLLFSAFFFSLVQVLINNLSNKVNQLVIPQYFGITSLIISSIVCIIDPSLIWRNPSLIEAILLLLLGLVSYLQQIFLNRAYMKGDLTEMSMLGQTQILYGYIFDILRGAHISYLSVLGSILIVGALFKVIMDKKKQREKLQKELPK
ncbi:unnamed protein product [Paramecium primaurelia]|uniref:EamA domain-containing protein n=1 Tax=Paramecium primaurelia TaxID=5886 RepID=A0A8S1MMW6_PARPR|nr:unnamed protein product [Paramecium primaurelia]